ncbi:MAG: homocysteine S-methyltransferase family protein [Hyphomicrobiaceae bacterium]
MPARSNALPQVASSTLFLTDSGLETTLVFHEGIELPHFAAFPLLDTTKGRSFLADYFERHIAIARRLQVGFVLESPTWRASREWGARLGYSPEAIADLNCESIAFLRALEARHRAPATPMVVSGCVGPRGDGYVPGEGMTAAEAEDYHGHQVAAFAAAGADLVTAITMTNTPEAIGMANAASRTGIPAAISFTVETDGKLPTGQGLGDAIDEVDRQTAGSVAYYMLNCAHPTHFDRTLEPGRAWMQRIRGLRANASCRSHQELNEAAELDADDPVELGRQYQAIRRRFPNITILGGCCGTDHRHIEEIGSACVEARETVPQ